MRRPCAHKDMNPYRRIDEDFIIAVKKKNWVKARNLLKKGANPTYRYALSIKIACYNKLWIILYHIIEHAKLPPFIHYGIIVKYAIGAGNIPFLKYLMSKVEGDFWKRPKKFIKYAVINGHKDMFKFLIDNGYKINSESTSFIKYCLKKRKYSYIRYAMLYDLDCSYLINNNLQDVPFKYTSCK